MSARIYPTHDRAGSDSERQSVGLPGHCEDCAEHGHVKAHPDLGCGDVGCTAAHGEQEEALFDVRLTGHYREWLASQNEAGLRIAREVTRRRGLLPHAPRRDIDPDYWHDNGVIWGLLLALSYLSDRPGDISGTGAEQFITDVAYVDEYLAKAGADGAEATS